MKVIVIFDIVCYVSILFCMYMVFVRIPKAGKLRLKMVDLVYEYNIRLVNSATLESLSSLKLIKYDVLPELNNLIFSFRRLTLENWLDEKLLDKLLYGELNSVLEENNIVK